MMSGEKKMVPQLVFNLCILHSPPTMILNILSKERSAYGLRNGDHDRYRRHCSNKMRHLRKTQSPLLPLFSAERALAHSHSLKSKDRRGQLSWLRKALKHASTLTSIEGTIYHLGIRAELSFERSDWAATLTDLAARRRLLAALANSAADPYHQALANEFIDNYDPLIRFSAHKLGREDSHDIDGVVADLDEMLDPAIAKMIQSLPHVVDSSPQVTFASQTIPVRNPKVTTVMTKISTALAQLSKNMASWDRVLSVLGEAEIITKDLDPEIHQYILHLLLSHRIKRDLALVETLETPNGLTLPSLPSQLEPLAKSLAAKVKLFDAVLQSMSQLCALPIIQEKDSVRPGAEGLEAYFHALKLYHLARIHCLTETYSSAVQLLARASTLAHQAQSYLTDFGPLEEQVVTPNVDSLFEQISTLDTAAKRALFHQRVPKPTFFDTAFNYIDMPMETQEKQPEVSSKENVSSHEAPEKGSGSKPKSWLGWLR